MTEIAKEDLTKTLEKNVSSLEALTTQLSALLDTIKRVDNPATRQALLYTYKQSYDALEQHLHSTRDLVKAIQKESQRDEVSH